MSDPISVMEQRAHSWGKEELPEEELVIAEKNPLVKKIKEMAPKKPLKLCACGKPVIIYKDGRKHSMCSDCWSAYVRKRTLDKMLQEDGRRLVVLDFTDYPEEYEAWKRDATKHFRGVSGHIMANCIDVGEMIIEEEEGQIEGR